MKKRTLLIWQEHGTLALPHFVQNGTLSLLPSTSSHTASLCIPLRLIHPRNQANRLPGQWSPYLSWTSKFLFELRV